jgi:hypothetical protein
MGGNKRESNFFKCNNGGERKRRSASLKVEEDLFIVQEEK